MPYAPLRPCAQPGCPALVTRGRCPKHRLVKGNTTERGYGAAWRALAKWVLERDPICTICRIARSTEADHIIPKAQGGTDDFDNLRGTCRPCNRARRPQRGG